MHCRRARTRIRQLSEEDRSVTADRELSRHIAECDTCARQAESAGLLARALAAARSEPDNDLMPLPERRRRVTERVRKRQLPASERRWSWKGQSVVAGATMVVVALLLLIPFNYYRTVGYNLSLAGVNQDLAEDESICDLLYNLGLHEADVDVLGCDSTCKVLVMDLKSREEAHLVYSALQQIDDDGLRARIVPIKTPESSSLLERANEKIRGALN